MENRNKFYYLFRDEEKKEFRKILKKVTAESLERSKKEFEIYKKNVGGKFEFDPGSMQKTLDWKTELFIELSEGLCNRIKKIKEMPKKTDHPGQLEDILKTFRKTSKALNKICNSKVQINNRRDISDPLLSMDSIDVQLDLESKDITAEKAFTADENLKKIMSEIESTLKNKPGRGSPGSFTTEFAKALAVSFEHCFSMRPTAYYDGHFAKLYLTLLNIIGVEVKEPSRALKTALKKLNTPSFLDRL